MRVRNHLELCAPPPLPLVALSFDSPRQALPPVGTSSSLALHHFQPGELSQALPATPSRDPTHPSLAPKPADEGRRNSYLGAAGTPSMPLAAPSSDLPH